MSDTFEFSDQEGVIYRPADREYRCQDGEFVRRPDGKMFLVRNDDDTFWVDPVETEKVPENAVIVELVLNRGTRR